jgi:squalene cyclase
MRTIRRTTESLELAITRGQRALFRAQLASGAWDDRSDVGPISTAMVLVSLGFLGRLSPGDRKDGARWLRARQRPDGSFVGRPFAHGGDLGTTAVAWAALGLDDAEESKAAATRARAYVEAHGGAAEIVRIMAKGDVSALFCAMGGVLDPSLLPDPHLAWALIPGAVELTSHRVHFGIVMGALMTSLLAKRMRGVYGPDGKDVSFFAKKEHARAIELLSLFQNADGSMNSNTVQTAMMLPALHAAGLPVDSGPVARGVDWLLSRRVASDDGVWFDVFASDVWSTAFTMRALMRTGIPPADPRITKGVSWLLSRQLTVDQPWPNQRKRGAVKHGGWPFQTGNETMADADDAGVVLSALALALEKQPEGRALDPVLADRVRASMVKARAWLRDMQNPDGGWSAFVCGLPIRPNGPIMTKPIDVPPDSPIAAVRVMLNPPPDLGDPSTEDLTGRVLHGLAGAGAKRTDDEVVKAVAFLRRHQTEDGAFWGRWVVNYVASTSYVLSALDALGEDPAQELVQRALRFLLSHQNADGGWGEAIDTYAQPRKAGIGHSTAPLTSLVVCALVDQGLGDGDEVRRAIEYLLAKQRPDGTWPNDDYLATNIPPEGFYVYDGAARHMPLEALGRYARRHEPELVRAPESWGRWTTAILEPARHRMDPLADAVVDEIHAAGDLGGVNKLLRTIFENDDPVPSGLPECAARFFEETVELPPWADAARIRRAQRLFEDHGPQITFGLFCSSLPQAYAAANGSLVLTHTGAMTGRVRQRIFETAQFLFDVLDVGGLDPRGRGIRSSQRVRLMHAGVRRLLLTSPKIGWDAARLGAPINQEDLAGTLMTFSAITFDAMRRLGVEATEEEGDDWIHLWGVIGHFLGVDRELVPANISDARHLMDAIRERQWAPSKSGAQLAGALVAFMQQFFTQGLLDGLTPTLVRFLAGDQCGDVLELPRADWTRTFVGAAASVAGALDEDAREDVLERAFGKLAGAVMEAIILHEREGKRASFRVPASLRRTVIPHT